MADYKLRIIVEGVDKATPALNSVKGALGNIGQIAAGVGIGNLFTGAVSGLADMARGALDSYAAYERLGLSLNSLAAKEALLTGQAATMGEAMAMTSGKSKELLDWVQKLAIESPFRQEDVSSAFRLSMALGFNTAEAQRLTRAMVDFSTATGAGGETIERVSRALGQMKTKGKLSAEEMLQLSEAGVDANAILMRAFDMTGPQLFDAMKKGAIDVNAAIEAIVSEMEKLYGGAAKNSAASMSGLLSTLSEIGELSSRNLLAGVFQAAQPTIASIVGILSAPEFQAGLTAWGETLGGFAADGLESAAAAMERVDAALTPLLDKGAPPWLVALQGLATVSDYQLDIKISPEVTTIKTPDGGLTVDVTATATTVTSKDGGLLRVDVVAGEITADANTKDNIPPVKLVADWQKGTIGSLIAADWTDADAEQHKILMKAGWTGDAAIVLQGLLNVNDFIAKVTPVLNMNPAQTGGVAGFDLGTQIANSIDWAAYKTKWQQVFDSWSPILKPIAQVNWGEEFSKTRTVNAQLGTFDWGALWSVVRVVNAALGSFDWGGLWDKIYTVNATVKRTYQDVNPYPIYGPQMGAQNTAGSGLGGWDNPGWADDVRAFYGDAIGDGFFRGGWALVGENEPELLNLPRGTQIFNGRDTKALLRAGIPGFAEGTTDIPGWLQRGLTAIGLWVPQQQARQYGPPTREEAYGTWRKIEQKGTEALQGTAKQAGDAFEDAAKNTNDAFKSALQNVPGLFGTSQVTGDQMKMAELGVPQNFADDYLRRLSDEVLNGVDWEGVDITDAANRAGIDPNLPANVILELFKNAWNDSSLFANAGNLDLINQDAVKAAIEQQQKELQGKANVLQLFGITDKNLQEQSDALGAGLASVFGKAAESDAMKAAGTQAFAAIGAGFSDNNTAVAAVGGMAKAVITATGTPENAAALEDAGKAAAFAYYGGWKSFMSEAAPPPPGGNTTPIGPAPAPAAAPGRAVGVGYWAGGWMTVHANETIYAPRGTSVQTARESAEGGRMVVNNNNYITINRAIDEEAFLARMARRLQRGY